MDVALAPKPSIDTPAVKRSSRRLAAVAVAAIAALLPALAMGEEAPPATSTGAVEMGTPPPAALPPKKGAPPPVAPLAAPGNQKRELPPEERALRGVVTIERAGQALGLGMVLMGDGRILTALSPLGPGNDLDARFADGTAVRVKLGHHNRAWDLALLVPQTGRWQEGLAASSREPVRQDAAIRSFSSSSKNKIGAVPMVLRSHRSLLGGDDTPIDNALEIGSRVSPLDLGAPIIDEEGKVVAILGRGCAPNENRPCTPVAFGAPIAAIKTFLRTVPPTAVPPPAWLGIQGVAETSGVAKGVRVLGVHPQSPAEEAKIKGGDRGESDIILAVDGVPVTTPEGLADAIHAHGVGEKVPMTLFSQGKYREVTVVLRAAPETKASASPPANPAELPQPDAAPAPGAPPPPRRR